MTVTVTNHHPRQKLQEREKQMANYKLNYVKAQSFYGSESVSALLLEAAGFISALEQSEDGLGVTVNNISVDYTSEGEPYVNVFYESV